MFELFFLIIPILFFSTIFSVVFWKNYQKNKIIKKIKNIEKQKLKALDERRAIIKRFIIDLRQDIPILDALIVWNALRFIQEKDIPEVFDCLVELTEASDCFQTPLFQAYAEIKCPEKNQHIKNMKIQPPIKEFSYTIFKCEICKEEHIYNIDNVYVFFKSTKFGDNRFGDE